MKTKLTIPERYLRERGTDTYCPAAFNPDGTLFGVTLGLNLIQDELPKDVIGEFEIKDDGNIQIYLYGGR